MAYTIYDACVPVMVKMLHNLKHVVQTAAAHATANNIAPATLLEARLAPDMFPFTKQVQIATDQAKGATARLSGTDIPKYDDTETTFDALVARIDKTLAFIETVSAEKFVGAEDKDIELALSFATFNFKGSYYLSYWVLPNFFFHVTTAYDILRHHGVSLAKADFLGK